MVQDERIGRRGRMVGACVALAILAGCYRYVPVELPQVAPGTPVRANLTGAAMDRLRSASGEGPVVRRATIDGRLTRTTADSVVIGVESTIMEANVRSRTFYSDMAFLKSDVRTFQLRQLDRRRTTLTAIGLGVGAVAAVLIAVEYGGSSTGSNQQGPGVPEQRFPAGIRISFP